MPQHPLPLKECECPRHEMYRPNRKDQKYATNACKLRVRRLRNRKRWYEYLAPEDRKAWEMLRSGKDTQHTIAISMVDSVGELKGHIAARQVLLDVLQIMGYHMDQIFPIDPIVRADSAESAKSYEVHISGMFEPIDF